MPGFKPKFAVPSSQVEPVFATPLEVDEFPAKAQINNITCEPIDSNSDLAVKSNNESCSAKCQQVMTDTKPLNALNEASVNCRNTAQKGLTDADYDEIFDTVIANAVAGVLSVCDKVAAVPDSTQAAAQFSARTSNVSPVNIQVQNEVTPNTSPQDETSTSPKLLLQRPVKKAGCKKDPNKSFHKRKTLDYLASNSAEVRSEKFSKHGQKTKERRRKSDTDVITHRKKILNKGVWVQCGERSCLKWRYLRHVSDPSVLPNFWRCSMNNEDKTQNNCESPEIDWTSCLSNSQDHFVYTEYNAGSIVWAKMAGYPPWPGMIDSDPDINLFYEYDHCGKVSHYHVVFLDDNVSRAWVSYRSIDPYTKAHIHHPDQYKKCNYRTELTSAIKRANAAVQLTLEERLEKYSFEKRFVANRKREDWIPKRLSHKPHKIAKKESQGKNHQVVPVRFPCSTHEEEKAPLDDYWEGASDGENAPPKPKKSPKKDSLKSKLKEAKPKANRTTTVGSQLSKVLAKAKAPLTPSFKAPCRKGASPKHGEAATAVVPTSPQPAANDESVPVKENLTFDPDIYTMEIDENEKDERKKITSKCDDATELHDEDMKPEEEEPLDLSLKYNTAEEEDNHVSPVLNNDLIGRDFWDAPEGKTDFGVLEDAFNDLEGKMLDGWEEEKLKHLDELMPVITDNF